MGFSNTNSIERKSRVDTYTKDVENVKDIKDDLSKLKKSITNGQEASVTANENITYNNASMTRETFAISMDTHVENAFDNYVNDNQDHIKELLKKGQAGQDELAKEFNEKIRAGVLIEFSNDKMILDANIIKQFQFELTDLKQEVVTMIGGTENNNDKGNPFHANPNGQPSEKETPQQQTVEGYHPEQDYIEKYKSFGYADLDDNYEIEDIYKDSKEKKLRKVMATIFDDEKEEDGTRSKEVRKATFNINLDTEDGLAGLIIAIRESVQYKDLTDKKDLNYKYKIIYDNLVESSDLATGTIELKKEEDIKKALDKSFESDLDSDENNKGLLKSEYLTYNRKGGFDGEINKIAKILGRSSWEDLDTFASLLQSKADIQMAMKEWNNALEITGQTRNDKKEDEDGNPETTTTQITADNVFGFLCDFNGEGIVSAEYNKKFQSQQENQGDVGPLFGQQVLWTIEQAIAVQNVLHPGEGEQIVIHNIIKNMSISNSTVTKKLDAMLGDQSACTKKNLVQLINGYDEGGTHVEGNPEFKILFLDAIKKINGGSAATQPDLYETLASYENEDEKFLLQYYEGQKDLHDQIGETIKTSLNESQNPEIIEMIRTQGLVRVRETCVTQVMNAIDHIEITLPNGESSLLRAAGMSKSWILRQAYEEVMKNLVQNLISLGIHGGGGTGIILSLGTGQEGQSESGRTKRARGAGAGVNITDNGPKLAIKVSGEIAEQYNYNTVINANLSEVHSAKYLGLEGSAGATISVFDKSGAEVSGGFNRQKDLTTGINQINQQYENVSFGDSKHEYEGIFNISSDIDPTDKTAVEKHIQDKINHPTGKYQTFIENNRQHLSDNLAFIIRYMDTNGFFGKNGKISKLPAGNKTLAVNDLIAMMQEGNMDLRRHNVVAGLHGKLELTKLSFGVTSDMLTIPGLFQPKATAPNALATGGEATNQGGIGVGGDFIGEDDKFGIFGFYAGMRLSTWRNIYVPNEQQYLYTMHEMGQGIGIDNTFVEHEQDLQKDVTKYAAYLQALFNSDILTCSANADNTIQIQFNGKGEHPTIFEYLNIHATAEAEKNFSIKNNILTIGNVGPMAAYTVTEAKGVRRVLCLGTKKLDDAHRVTAETLSQTTNTVAPITSQEQGFKAWEKDQLTSTIISNMKQGTTDAPTEIETETAQFFDDKGAFKKPKGYTINTEIVEGTKFTTGTLTISKNETDKTNKTYTITYNPLPENTFTIEYIDESIYNEEASVNREIITTPINNTNRLFSFEAGSELANVQKLLDGLTTTLQDIEQDSHKNNKKEYFQFLSSASNVFDGTTINDTELIDALNHLNTLLPNNDTKVDQLKSYLNSNNRYTKTYIIDRFKQIFAKENWFSGQQLSAILSKHTGRETVKGPSNIALPQSLITEMQQQRNRRYTSGTIYKYNPISQNNLFGYTAFYRPNPYRELADRNKSFSLTSLGNTTSQVDPYIIEEKNKESARDRFLNNLKINEKEVEYLAQSLEKQFAEKGVSVKLFVEGKYDQTRTNISALLSEKQLDKNQITIDSGVKISIDVDYVFYLLGECCNESIGANITAIKIDRVKDDIAGKYSATGTPDKNYINGVNLYGASHSISSNVVSNESRVGINKFINRRETGPTATTSSGETTTGSTIDAGTIDPGEYSGIE